MDYVEAFKTESKQIIDYHLKQKEGVYSLNI
jgi:hypothetical protein